MLCFRSGGSTENVSCYGTPKAERKKKNKKSLSETRVKGMPKSDPGGVDYTQISSRIIALTFPTNGYDVAYRGSVKEISETLKKSYGDRYKIFNVSQKRSDLGRANVGAVVELGWPDQLAPPLDKLCSICKQIETWLNANPENLAVIHCKGWRSRAAIVIAAYMHYINICASEDTVADRFSMQMFSEKFLEIDGQPSHKRYVKYFANLLSGTTKVNTTPIFLTQITLYRMNTKSIVLKIYERMKPVYSTGTINLKEVSQVGLENGVLSLRGDVLVKCFEKSSAQERVLLFQCQFNTCALDLDSASPILRFFKDELDLLVQNKFDSQASIEFSFLLEPPKNSIPGKKNNNIQQTISDFSRADSYENFDRPEDDRSLSSSVDVPVYSEIHKQQPTDGTDSGIGSDSPKASKNSSVPPMVPPKPRRDSDFTTDSINGGLDDAYRSAYEDSVIGRDHSVLPASLRPKNQNPNLRDHSPQAPSEGGRSTPRVAEPDLLPPDRYDRSSKCFSYVPAKSLKEHYTAPKKPPQRRPSVERSNLDIPESVAIENLRQVNLTPTDLVRRPETPKWDEEIDKVCPPIRPDDLDRPRRHDYHRSLRDFENPHTSAYEKNFTNGYSNGGPQKAYSTNHLIDEDVEQPMVIDQAKRAPIKRRGRYGSFSAVNDDEYASDMDELMDPDFYMTYSSANTPVPERSVRQKTAPPLNSGSKSVELPRKAFKTISQKELDEIDSIIESTATLPPPRSCHTPNPKPQPSNDRDSFRYRNCRSVTAAPIHRERKLFSNDRYDSITDCDNPDDWLKAKLKALHSKRFMDPESMNRRNVEKVLLEELKNANSERDLSKNEYTSEGMGKKREEDPLEEYKKEEERLRNTRSPFIDMPQHERRVGTPNSMSGDPRRVFPPRGATPTGQIIREKPPTPPPRGERDRSRSPARSPLVARKKPQPVEMQKSTYQKERDRIANTDYLSDDEDGDNGEFGHLKSLVQDNCSNNFENGTLSSQYSTTKSILKKRESNSTPATSNEPTADIYASPVPANRRMNAQTPLEVESTNALTSIYSQHPYNSYPSATLQPTQRSETPAFPVNSRETPLPFHPLLYQGATTTTPTTTGKDMANNDPYHPNTNMTNRSASPRSMYYGHSRRSSLTSDAGEVIHHHPVFVKDTSKYWYKPNISREEAINMLRDKPPGTFVVRDSNSFPGAFGLALKVSQPPAGVAPGDGTELVRHFLIEPSPKGVKLKGCNNEPIFGSLAALVYQHSITPMALPTKLILPEYDPAASPEHLNAAQALLEQGAACNVTYICSYDTESLTGPEAVRRTISEAFALFNRGAIKPVSVHFKVSAQGITLTDNTRTMFFRRHYPVISVTYAGIDPKERRWDNNNVIQLPPTYVRQARIFGFVARKLPTRPDNVCHVFAELDPEQPASAVVNFITKVMMGQSQKKSTLQQY